MKSIEQKRRWNKKSNRKMSHGYLYYHIDNDKHNFYRGSVVGYSFINHYSVYHLSHTFNDLHIGLVSSINRNTKKLLDYTYLL